MARLPPLIFASAFSTRASPTTSDGKCSIGKSNHKKLVSKGALSAYSIKVSNSILGECFHPGTYCEMRPERSAAVQSRLDGRWKSPCRLPCR
ncbi:hypothetical protein M413DRAFT_236021 [Hebeloma cylindrosporum]|uniref:Uncharacterized protein n=1 Tax=Hebeloma cylindrosporum TaxID=76867 RepID=A0A0C2XN81_HEBCY|nr:hypothetical protein M413DRAFT_236021 [Hebeloma cylindrosporum h7]